MNDDELRSAFDDLLADLPPERGLPVAVARRVSRRRGLKAGAGVLGGAGVVVAAASLFLGGTGTEDGQLVGPATGPTPSPSVPVSPSPSPSPSLSLSPSPATSPSAAPPVSPSPVDVLPSPSTVPPLPGTGASPDVSPPSSPSPSPSAVRIVVVLRPDGLGFSDGGSSTSALAFGSDASTVARAVARALGPGRTSPTPDCGTGRSAVEHRGLQLQVEDGAFVGWVATGPGPVTGDGLHVGSTLADLRASITGLSVTTGTLGAEFSTTEGGYAGFLDGTSATSRVTNLGAGFRGCIAR